MTETSANKVADYILRSCHDSGELISNLKLQKLLYYAQAWYLALYDRSLFNDRLEAWVHGPVQPAVYGRFKHHRWDPISDQPDDPKLPLHVSAHLDEIMQVYGVETAYALELMTHREAPWIEARAGLPADQPSNTPLSHKSMASYYKAMADRAANNERTT